MINKILKIANETLSDIGTIGLLTLGSACILYVFKWWTIALVIIFLVINTIIVIKKIKSDKHNNKIKQEIDRISDIIRS